MKMPYQKKFYRKLYAKVSIFQSSCVARPDSRNIKCASSIDEISFGRKKWWSLVRLASSPLKGLRRFTPSCSGATAADVSPVAFSIWLNTAPCVTLWSRPRVSFLVRTRRFYSSRWRWRRRSSVPWKAILKLCRTQHTLSHDAFLLLLARTHFARTKSASRTTRARAGVFMIFSFKSGRRMSSNIATPPWDAQREHDVGSLGRDYPILKF